MPKKETGGSNGRLTETLPPATNKHNEQLVLEGQANKVLPRVFIVGESKRWLEVEFDGKRHKIILADRTEVDVHEGTVLLDAATPREMWEVQIFHELQERSYIVAGLADAHERATQDEVAYILEHCPQQMENFKRFAKNYRADATLKLLVVNKERKAALESAKKIVQWVTIFEQGLKFIYPVGYVTITHNNDQTGYTCAGEHLVVMSDKGSLLQVEKESLFMYNQKSGEIVGKTLEINNVKDYNLKYRFKFSASSLSKVSIRMDGLTCGFEEAIIETSLSNDGSEYQIEITLKEIFGLDPNAVSNFLTQVHEIAKDVKSNESK